MYIDVKLKRRLDAQSWFKHLAKGVVTLIEDLKKCGCEDYKVINNMVKLLLKESRTQSSDEVEIFQIAMNFAHQTGSTKEVCKLLDRITVS